MNFKQFGRTANLFPDNSVRYEYALGSNARIVSYTGGAMYIIPIANDATYTCKIYTPDVSISVVRLALYDKSSPSAGDITYGTKEVLNQVEPTLTITNSYNKPYLIVQISGAYVDAYGIDDVMLNLGSTALPYQPYKDWTNISHYIMGTDTDTLTTLPTVIYANDTTATVGLKGNMEQNGTPTPDNPIQPSECGELEENVAIIENQSDTITNFFYKDVKLTDELPAGNYIVSFRMDSRTGDVQTSKLGWGTTTVYRGTITNFTISTVPITITRTVTLNENSCIWARFLNSDVPATFSYSVSDINITQGYKIPILNNSQTTNVYLGEVESTRKIKKLVLDGTENWLVESGVNGLFTLPNVAPLIQYNNQLCTHFSLASSYVNFYNTDLTFAVATRPCLLIHYNACQTVSEFKTFLAAEYAAGHPVTIWYVLAEPTTGILNEPIRKIGDYADEVSGITIPVTAGENTLSIDTTLQPSEVTVNYKGWHPASAVHKRENGAWT